jgi:hypothetical protein
LGRGVSGIGDWAQSPIPTPQSPIPNPHFKDIKNEFYFYSFNNKLIIILLITKKLTDIYPIK